MPLGQQLADAFKHIQARLFPLLREEVGVLTPEHERLVTVLACVEVEAFVPVRHGEPGRPRKDRQALARAFIAKSVLGLAETRMLLDRLAVDRTLRRLCGWEHARSVPGETVFSRAFAAFAQGELPTRMHKALIERTYGDTIIGHIATDATAIEAREKPVKPVKGEPDSGDSGGSGPAVPAEPEPKRKRGRPKKGEVVPPKPPRRLERQATMGLPAMLSDLPTHCSVGTKCNAKGYKTSWIGYKLHIATADGDVPVACLLTSAHVHDSQVAIPLMQITDDRVWYLYDLMDSAYDAPEIKDFSRALGHVPIVDHHTRRGEKAELAAEALAKVHAHYRTAEDVRYAQRTSVERVNGNLKDNRGGREVRVRGPEKMMCHLMFGILVIAVEQLLRLAT